jgi:SAM-dependent methyltransferase
MESKKEEKKEKKIENKNKINEEKPNEKVNWYKKREAHWASKEPVLLSVLGGFEKSHLPDVKCSCELLNGLILTKQLNPGNALDLAAGIGRVTEFVLCNFFKEIDLVEKDKKFIDKCKVKFSSNDKIKKIYMESLENFKFEKKYDLIWIQWCLENLEDEDLEPFLKKCYDNLNEDGIIIVKENLYNVEGEGEEEEEEEEDNYQFKYSELDYSKQRPDAFYINLFVKNKFKIKLHFLNPNWPEDMMPLCVYVLSKK